MHGWWFLTLFQTHAMKTRYALIYSVALAVCVQQQGVAAPDPGVSTESLLRDLVDLDGLATLPDPAFTCRQFSSYDRAAKSPAQDWFANGDAGQFLRVEERAGRKEHVMMDADGPGAIVRIWSANPEGVLRIYLDGSDQPVLEAPMQDVLGGRHPLFPAPLAGERSRGWNLYFPIPYAKHCKVTSDAGKFYYHVNYRTYAAGTPVASFTVAAMEEPALREAVRAVAATLATPSAGYRLVAGSDTRPLAASVAPGQTATLARLEGAMAIRRFQVRWQPGADRDEPALRSTVVEMAFDGETTVQAPLGDFFGSAPGLNPFDSLPLAVTAEGGMDSRWVMPFRESAEIRVRNLGPQPVALQGEITSAPRPWTGRSLHFHAGWRIQHDLPTEPKIDWNYLHATGQGVFAGAAFSIDNPVKDWWGEGDEKIYVDGEAFPSHFGTGTEDYYGYAWCDPKPFTHAYHNQPRCDGPANFGRTSVNRFHILDRIPFAKDFRFDMEIWHWAKCKVNASVTTYWYARPGAPAAFAPIQPEDVKLRPAPVRVVPRVAGAIEGEGLRVIARQGVTETQDWPGTSAEQQLWWRRGQKPGDKLVLGFPAPAAGRFQVRGRFLRAPDYAIVRLSVNGRPAGGPVDFYHPKVLVGEESELGVFDLTAGENRLQIEVVGANEKAEKSYMVGLDYLRLEPAQ